MIPPYFVYSSRDNPEPHLKCKQICAISRSTTFSTVPHHAKLQVIDIDIQDSQDVQDERSHFTNGHDLCCYIYDSWRVPYTVSSKWLWSDCDFQVPLLFKSRVFLIPMFQSYTILQDKVKTKKKTTEMKEALISSIIVLYCN